MAMVSESFHSLLSNSEFEPFLWSFIDIVFIFEHFRYNVRCSSAVLQRMYQVIGCSNYGSTSVFAMTAR
jgi:hypothetical protein